MIRYAVLGSGSSGNSYIISYNGCSILFDAGFSLKQLRERTQRSGIDFSTVQALFITHLHPDHARGAGVFARKTGVPVFLHDSIDDQYSQFAALKIPSDSHSHFSPDAAVNIKDFSVTGFYTSHDSPHCVGFFIEVKGRAFLLLTDTGVLLPHMYNYGERSDVLFLEANYDSSMLERGPYPYPLKRRISGEFGHLSNSDAIGFLNTISTPKDQHVYFCHLSKTNNDENILHRSCEKGLTWKGTRTICTNGKMYSSTISIEGNRL